MIFFPALLIGGYIGWLHAARKRGTPFDKVQYALVYGILFGIVALFLTILYRRMT